MLRRLLWWATLLGLLSYTTYVVQTGRAAWREHEVWLSSLGPSFIAVPPLSEREVGQLRRSLNAAHVRAAQAGGITPTATRAALDSLHPSLGLVRLDRPSPYYVASAGTYSQPLAVPAVAAALDSIGTRFHAALAEAGLPLYRFVVTSVLRTSEDQTALRRVNANAAERPSSHEFATTFDVTYRRFQAVGDDALALPEAVTEMPGLARAVLGPALTTRRRMRYQELAERYPDRLAALLGRALIDLENDGVVLALRERQQPVYHVTVARALP